jgi:predicted metal-dependent HD superfamily phosphohydrolase
MLSDTLLAEIQALHDGPERGYHGWSHPLALLRLLEEVEGALDDPLAVRCAILLHDAIYEPRRPDNETRSAELARRMLDGVVPDVTLERAVRLIEATQRHAIPEDLAPGEIADMARFLDMDLSILGARADVFDAYEAGVRHEYREVPDELFRQGRAAILESFLGREALYFSDWGRARFEARARENLGRSIAQLKAGR